MASITNLSNLLLISLVLIVGAQCRVLKVDPVEDALYEACTQQETIPFERFSRLLSKFEKVNDQSTKDQLLNSFMYDEHALIHWSNISTILSSFPWEEYKEKWRNLLINRMARIHVDDVLQFINRLSGNVNEKMTLLGQIKQKINNLTREKKLSVSKQIFGIDARSARKASLMLDAMVPDCVYEDLEDDNIVIALGNEHAEHPKPLGKYSLATSFDALKIATVHALRRLKPTQKFGLAFLTNVMEDKMGGLLEASPENIRKAVQLVEDFEYKPALGLFLDNLIGLFQQEDGSAKSSLFLVGKVTDPEVPVFNVGSQVAKLHRNYSVIPKINTVGFFINDSDSLDYLKSISRVYNQYSSHTGGTSIRLYTPEI